MIAVYMLAAGVLFGLALLIYYWKARRTDRSRRSTSSDLSRMAAGPANQVRVAGDWGAKFMPLNLRTGREDEKRS